MDLTAAARALSALAQEWRLRIFRILARESPQPVSAGDLAEQLDLPASTLSFHLQHLVHAGLVSSERKGRSIMYALRRDQLKELLWFLGEDCCQGRVDLCCDLTARIKTKKREASMSDTQPGVLFICSRNSARSQMAEAILRREAGDRYAVYSGGLKPQEIHPMTLRVLEEVGIDTSGLFPKDIGRFLGKVAIHYAIVVCESANEQCPTIYPFALELLYWPFPDPVAAEGTEKERLEHFRAVRDAITERVRSWLRESSPAHPKLRKGPRGGKTG